MPLITPRPPVAFDSYDAIKDLSRFYTDYTPSHFWATVGSIAMRVGFPPDVVFEPGAQKDIAELEQSEAATIAVANHLTSSDHNALAGSTWAAPELRYLIGRTPIPSRPDYFQKGSRIGRALRIGMDTMGAVPAQRRKELYEITQIIEAKQLDPAERQAQINAARDLQSYAAESHKQIFVSRLRNGFNMVSFAEGGRNEVNPREVQQIKRGLFDVGSQVDRDMYILPMGLQYPERIKDGKLHRNIFRPVVHVGRPFSIAFTELEQLETEVRPAVQLAVDAAVDRIRTSHEKDRYSLVDDAVAAELLIKEVAERKAKQAARIARLAA